MNNTICRSNPVYNQYPSVKIPINSSIKQNNINHNKYKPSFSGAVPLSPAASEMANIIRGALPAIRQLTRSLKAGEAKIMFLDAKGKVMECISNQAGLLGYIPMDLWQSEAQAAALAKKGCKLIMFNANVDQIQSFNVSPLFCGKTDWTIPAIKNMVMVTPKKLFGWITERRDKDTEIFEIPVAQLPPSRFGLVNVLIALGRKIFPKSGSMRTAS